MTVALSKGADKPVETEVSAQQSHYKMRWHTQSRVAQGMMLCSQCGWNSGSWCVWLDQRMKVCAVLCIHGPNTPRRLLEEAGHLDCLLLKPKHILPCRVDDRTKEASWSSIPPVLAPREFHLLLKSCAGMPLCNLPRSLLGVSHLLMYGGPAKVTPDIRNPWLPGLIYTCNCNH